MTFEPICFLCKHYNGGARYTCKAFPKGIPEEILFGKSEHEKPLPNQENEIVFEAKEAKGFEAIDYEKLL